MFVSSRHRRPLRPQRERRIRAKLLKAAQSAEGPRTIAFASQPEEEPCDVILNGKDLGLKVGASVTLTVEGR
jgi:hypothetical protein